MFIYREPALRPLYQMVIDPFEYHFAFTAQTEVTEFHYIPKHCANLTRTGENLVSTTCVLDEYFFLSLFWISIKDPEYFGVHDALFEKITSALDSRQAGAGAGVPLQLSGFVGAGPWGKPKIIFKNTSLPT